MRQELLVQADNRLEQLSGSVLSQMDAGDSVDQLDLPGDVRLTVVDVGGKVRLETDRPLEVMDENLNFRPEIETAIKNGKGRSTRYSRTLDREMIYVAIAVKPADADLFVVRLALSLDEVTHPFSYIPLIILILTFFIVLLTVLLLFWMQRSMVGQMKDMVQLARGIGSDAPNSTSARLLVRRVSAEFSRLAARIVRVNVNVRSRLDEAEQSQAETQGILASMSNGVIALDTDRRVLTMNPAATRMFGLLGRDIRGRLLEETVRDPGLLSAITDGMDEGRILYRELELETLGGRTVEVAIEPLYGGVSLTMNGVLIILNETTRLRRLERIRKDFAANVSHELRTPLTAIRGYIELLDQSVNDEKGMERLKVVERNAERLNAIIEDLLTLSRLESDEGDSTSLQIESILTDSLLQGVASLCQQQAEAAGISVNVESTEGLKLECNRHLIDQALINLLENAIRYSEPGTMVTLSSRLTGRGELELSVRDQGSGIAMEHLSRLFERFYRVDAGRSREQGGTGLGLSIVKHIALIHGGQAGVESQVGSGSTFFITLPQASQLESTEA